MTGSHRRVWIVAGVWGALLASLAWAAPGFFVGPQFRALLREGAAAPGAQEDGARVEYFHLDDMDIHACRACEYCRQPGWGALGARCWQQPFGQVCAVKVKEKIT